MITYEEALARILEQIEPMPTRSLPVSKIFDYVTAEPLVSPIDSPPFDNSAVDGFGVRLGDVAASNDANAVKLSVKATVRAGDAALGDLQSGQAMKILTGAAVPACVDAVVMKEFCEEKNGHVFVKHAVRAGDNIRRRGGEFMRGHEVVQPGTKITPAVAALIANLGYDSFRVHRKPRASVITTGNELTKPGRRLLPGRIYDSNSYAMSAALRAAGVEEISSSHASEDMEGTRNAFKRALRFADVVVSTGGVSVGEFDYVKGALESLGVETNIWKIAIKPGKPVYFGVYRDPRSKRRRYVFGLPGNPVSALVTFQLFVVPAIVKMSGVLSDARPLTLNATLTKTLKKKAGRAEFVRARAFSDNGKLFVEPTRGQDSHMLSGIARANALIVFPLEQEELAEGTSVVVHLLDWQ